MLRRSVFRAFRSFLLSSGKLAIVGFLNFFSIIIPVHIYKRFRFLSVLKREPISVHPSWSTHSVSLYSLKALFFKNFNDIHNYICYESSVLSLNTVEKIFCLVIFGSCTHLRYSFSFPMWKMGGKNENS